MEEIPYNLSLAYKEQIDEMCKPLVSMGLKHAVMYLLFNDGSTFVLSNLYSLAKPYYQEGLSKEDYVYTRKMLISATPGYYLYEETPCISNHFKKLLAKQYKVYPIYNLVRPHAECSFVFSAIRDTPSESPQLFYEKTLQKFETFCIQFVDAFLDLIIHCNPTYRFSFILTNKKLRDAVIRQGYEEEITLSMRQQECLWHAMQGKSAKEIGQQLQISYFTVETHLKNIRERFHCNSLNKLLLECIHRGIIGKMGVFNAPSSTKPDHQFHAHEPQLSK